jgi:hypothetical protein
MRSHGKRRQYQGSALLVCMETAATPEVLLLTPDRSANRRQLMERPTQLALLPHEAYDACSRAVGDIGTPLLTDGVEALGVLVAQMTSSWVMAEELRRQAQVQAAQPPQAPAPAGPPPPSAERVAEQQGGPATDEVLEDAGPVADGEEGAQAAGAGQVEEVVVVEG